ncbi:MAG: hypothetical protein JW803_02985 [Endomicrobiales bacterium]|nr:hypothetical protein [Endomicrobiales bacterium]
METITGYASLTLISSGVVMALAGCAYFVIHGENNGSAVGVIRLLMLGLILVLAGTMIAAQNAGFVIKSIFCILFVLLTFPMEIGMLTAKKENDRT